MEQTTDIGGDPRFREGARFPLSPETPLPASRTLPRVPLPEFPAVLHSRGFCQPNLPREAFLPGENLKAKTGENLKVRKVELKLGNNRAEIERLSGNAFARTLAVQFGEEIVLL